MVETTTAEQTERVKCFDANLVVKQGEAVLVRVSRRCSRQISSFLDLRFLSGRWKLLKLIEVNVTDSSFKNKKLSFSVLDPTKKEQFIVCTNRNCASYLMVLVVTCRAYL